MNLTKPLPKLKRVTTILSKITEAVNTSLLSKLLRISRYNLHLLKNYARKVKDFLKNIVNL